MSYMHIDNLYKAQDILQFKKCYAMEKVHGTSAHVSYKGKVDGLVPPSLGEASFEVHVADSIDFFSGGASPTDFLPLFDKDKLFEGFRKLGHDRVIVYGEAYGGKMQGMKDTYGPKLKFVAFEVKIGDHFLSVPKASLIAQELGLDFVHYVEIDTTIEEIDKQRDADSMQACKCGMGLDHICEGIVLRPPFEVRLNSGARVIAKHKRPEFTETKTKREVSPDKAVVLAKAEAIADEWVTPMRLQHVIDRIHSDGFIGSKGVGIEQTGWVIDLMVEDVTREAGEEIKDSREARRAIGQRAAKMYKEWLNSTIKEVL